MNATRYLTDFQLAGLQIALLHASFGTAASEQIAQLLSRSSFYVRFLNLSEERVVKQAHRRELLQRECSCSFAGIYYRLLEC